MSSKQDQQKPSAKKRSHDEYPMDTCAHMTSTSLRDLSSEYQRVGSEKDGSGNSKPKAFKNPEHQSPRHP